MNNVELIYSPYTLKLKKPFTSSRGNITERKGFILSLKGSGGKTGYGDASPFHEFGSESYEEAQRVLDNLNINLNIDLNNPVQSLEENLSGLRDHPAVRHGVEQAILDLVCKEKNTTLNHLLNRSSVREVKVNGIIGFHTASESAEMALDLCRQGYETIKIKVGRADFIDDLKVVKAVRKAVGFKTKIRLDVNGKWTLDEAVENLSALHGLNIEYVEEPVHRIENFAVLIRETSIPIAADESIRNFCEADAFIINNAAKVLVLKPMIIGGIIPTLKIIDLANENNIKVIITSSFESAVGRSMAVFTASLLDTGCAHGLSTARFFENDVAPDPYPVNEGKIVLG